MNATQQKKRRRHRLRKPCGGRSRFSSSRSQTTLPARSRIERKSDRARLEAFRGQIPVAAQHHPCVAPPARRRAVDVEGSGTITWIADDVDPPSSRGLGYSARPLTAVRWKKAVTFGVFHAVPDSWPEDWRLGPRLEQRKVLSASPKSEDVWNRQTKARRHANKSAPRPVQRRPVSRRGRGPKAAPPRRTHKTLRNPLQAISTRPKPKGCQAAKK